MNAIAGSTAQQLTFWVCMAVAIAVFGALIYSVVAHRPTTTRSSNAIELQKTRELGWVLLAIAIVIAAAAPSVKNIAAQNEAPSAQTRLALASASMADHR